jgi:hypothetical protein
VQVPVKWNNFNFCGLKKTEGISAFFFTAGHQIENTLFSRHFTKRYGTPLDLTSTVTRSPVTAGAAVYCAVL